ncbi:Fanconi anemia group B protein isoform X2 [Myripristis murdjan]|uniref:Fanconi anemia group B protein isoform X2 n=1 Tax=Myripristis murdjan TaxID=586833 RepID=UPI00117630FC|nr:Fanconi anemia group B protein isoform X2 [Myripristis murdjan]
MVKIARLVCCFPTCSPQGPTVLWSHAGGVFYTSLQAGEVIQIPIQISHSLMGELPLHKGQVFIVGLQKSAEEGFKDQSSGTARSQTLGYFVESGQVFDGTVILPHAYSCITQCILVLSAEDVDGVMKCSVVAATSKRQLVYFEHGIPKEACQLPFAAPKDIQVVNTGRNGLLFTISFDQGHVCAIWKETFQIASCWSGVSSVHVDDFLGFGTEQLLLVFEDQGASGHLLDNFLITDLCGTAYSRGQENEALKTPHLAQDNYLRTLQALESRLQSGLTELQELQGDLRVKERVLLQSVQALTDVVSDRKPALSQYEQEGLTALWDGDDESKDEAVDDKMQDMPAVSSKPQVDKLWHRIIEDRLVVGVISTTDSSIPVDSVSLSVLTEMGQRSTPAVIQTQSQVFWLPKPGPWSPSPPSTLSEPAAKRSKPHNAGRPNDANTCRLAVTTVTGLTPLLNSGGVKCPVMLHYVQRQESSALVNNPTPIVLHCGPILVDIQCNFQTQLLSSPKLKTDEVREDLLSLLAVLDHRVFLLDSPDHSLGDVDGWIQRTVGCERIEVSPQYLLFNSSGPSALMLFHWHQTTPFQGELSVHSRSQLQMLQFLDSLLGYLPASCSVQALKEPGGRGPAQMFSLTLEKEVLSLKDGVSSLLCGETADGERWSSAAVRQQESPEPGSAEKLQRCREEWDRDLERSRMRLSPLVDVGSYRRLSQSLSQVQLEVDKAALLETQRTLFSSGLL